MIYVILTAAGIGSRFGELKPKQFTIIDNKELLRHTIDCFDFLDCKIYIGLSNEYFDYFNDDRIVKYVGGDTGCETIKIGLNTIVSLNEIKTNDIVIISDGNRPLVSKQIIDDEIDFILKNQKSLVCPYLESFGVISSDGKRVIDRNSIYQVQMPCCCNLNLIYECYNKITHIDYNNPMEVYLNFYDHVDFISGDIKNIKITYKKDLDFLRLMMP